jgi:hypothetical protein
LLTRRRGRLLGRHVTLTPQRQPPRLGRDAEPVGNAERDAHARQRATPSPSPSPTGSASAGSAAQINAAMQSVENYYQACRTKTCKPIFKVPPPSLQRRVDSLRLKRSRPASPQRSKTERWRISSPTKGSILPPKVPRRRPPSSKAALLTKSLSSNTTIAIPHSSPVVRLRSPRHSRRPGIPPQTYRAEEGSASLDNVAALQNGGVDVLDISTHGGVYQKPSGSQYLFLSTTPVTAANMQKWSADLKSGNLVYGLTLYPSGYVALATFAFTPAFITSHVTFNPGAIVDNISCFGGVH